MLVWELEKLGIASSESLDGLISRRLEHALEQDNDRSFFTHTGLLNLMLEAEYGVGFHSKIFDKVEEEISSGKKGDT
jgi:hypothetical protein